jgi:hypothetical protein
MLDDIKDPDRKVTIEYWKPCKVDKKEYMSLRDVLNSIKVQGGIDGKDVHVIHGICPAPGGGWEAGVVSSIPLAHTQHQYCRSSSWLGIWLSQETKTASN